uniref:Uncharacterized protein n=1 Tax=Oryza punctata TaxID=4537 RepID=A0A0E0K261_ORYPU
MGADATSSPARSHHRCARRIAGGELEDGMGWVAYRPFSRRGRAQVPKGAAVLNGRARANACQSRAGEWNRGRRSRLLKLSLLMSKKNNIVSVSKEKNVTTTPRINQFTKDMMTTLMNKVKYTKDGKADEYDKGNNDDASLIHQCALALASTYGMAPPVSALGSVNL